MGYDIALIDSVTNKPCVLPIGLHFSYGSYSTSKGSNTTELAITYNYTKLLDESIIIGDSRGIAALDGKRGEDTKLPLYAAINSLSDNTAENEEYNNYWDATAANVKAALQYLYIFAVLYPECVWKIEK